MKIPELAYQFRLPKDTASSTLEQVLAYPAATAVAATSVIHELYRCPADRLFILTNLGGSALAGVAQLPTRIRVMANRNNVDYVIYDEFANANTGHYDATTRRLTATWHGELWFHPGWLIRAVGTFDAGGVANSVEMSVQGFLIPRGNAS